MQEETFSVSLEKMGVTPSEFKFLCYMIKIIKDTKFDRVTNMDIVSVSGFYRTTVSSYLTSLLSKGIIVGYGENRGSYYEIPFLNQSMKLIGAKIANRLIEERIQAEEERAKAEAKAKRAKAKKKTKGKK